MTRNEYLALRGQYEPEKIKLIIIAESPPASGKYFYNPQGLISEALFAALMKQLCFSPVTKEDGLCEFQRRGWVLVDGTYEPVDKLTGPKSNRDKVIARDYPLLRADLARLTPDHSTPLVLIKTNVYRILKSKLMQDGFIVLNHDGAIPFPSTGQQKKFHERFGAILRSVESPTARA
jgi:hypothetical protein